jgi:hypothetical protein
MKLKYRGVPYEYEPPTVTAEPTDMLSRYRGVFYQIPNLTTAPMPQPIRTLKYRGVPYQIGNLNPAEAEQLETMIPDLKQALLAEEALWLKYQLHPPIAH